MKTKKEQLKELIVEYGQKNYEYGLYTGELSEKAVAKRKALKEEVKELLKKLSEILKELPD